MFAMINWIKVYKVKKKKKDKDQEVRKKTGFPQVLLAPVSFKVSLSITKVDTTNSSSVYEYVNEIFFSVFGVN